MYKSSIVAMKVFNEFKKKDIRLEELEGKQYSDPQFKRLLVIMTLRHELEQYFISMLTKQYIYPFFKEKNNERNTIVL